MRGSSLLNGSQSIKHMISLEIAKNFNTKKISCTEQFLKIELPDRPKTIVSVIANININSVNFYYLPSLI